MDGELVERARAGDADAFDELVRRRIDAVYRMALGILGQPADALDATQDALISCWRKLPTLREVDRFNGWLSTITTNSCRMVLRRRRGVREVQLIPGSDYDADARPTAPPKISARAFDNAFERLSVEHRALLLEHHLDGRGLNEIASRLRVPVGTVKSRLYAARRALEKALGEAER